MLVEIIDSPGGLVEEGFAIGEFIRTLGVPTKALIKGYQCASIATYIARTCNVVAWEVGSSHKEKPFFLVHDPRVMGKIDCDEYACTADWFLSVGYDLKDAEHQIKQLYLHKTKAPTDLINELVATEKRMTPQEALEWGFIDEIIEPTKPKNMNLFDRVKAILAKLFSPEMADKLALEFKNLDITLEDGTMLYVETKDGEVEGKRVFDAEGNPASDGVKPLQDGRIITVENGVITAVQEVSADADAVATNPENPMNQEQIDALVQDAVAKAFAKVEKPTIKNTVPSRPTIAQMATASRKTKQPHQLDSVARYITQKRNPKISFSNEVVAPDYNITWEGEWLMEILREKVVSTPDFMRIFTVIDNVRYRQILQVVGFIDDILAPYEGCGDLTPVDGTTITDRVLETTALQVVLNQCAKDFDNTILMKWKNNGSYDRNNLEGTQLMDLYLELILDALQRGLFNLLSFGKISGTGLANAYKGIDGIWTLLLEDGATAGTGEEGCVTKFADITALDLGTGTTAEDYLREMYENSPLVLQQMPESEKAFFVTPNVYNNYLNVLQNRNATESAFRLLQDGTRELMFNGIPVVPIYAWARSLQSTANPYHADYNTLILYTTPKNHYIGIDGVQDSVRAFYDPDDNINKFRAYPVLGYNYALCDLQSIKVGKV